MLGHAAPLTPVTTPITAPGAPQDNRSVSFYSDCPQLSGDQLREAVAAIVDATAVANGCFAEVVPERHHPMAFLHCLHTPPFSFGYYAKALSRAKRDDAWLAALILADRCCRCTKVALTAGNMHRLMLTAFVVAVKCHVDCRRFSKCVAILGGIGQMDMNTMERSFLTAINWDTYISAQTYNEYFAMVGSIEAAAARCAAAVKGGHCAQRAAHYPLLPADEAELAELSARPAGPTCSVLFDSEDPPSFDESLLTLVSPKGTQSSPMKHPSPLPSPTPPPHGQQQQQQQQQRQELPRCTELGKVEASPCPPSGALCGARGSSGRRTPGAGQRLSGSGSQALGSTRRSPNASPRALKRIENAQEWSRRSSASTSRSVSPGSRGTSHATGAH